MVPRGVYVNDILGYVTPMHPGVKPRQPTKSHKYPPKFLPLSKGMNFLVDIIHALIKLKFEYHDLLLLKDVLDDPYELVLMEPSASIQRIPQPWVSGLNKYGLLGLINMPLVE